MATLRYKGAAYTSYRVVTAAKFMLTIASQQELLPPEMDNIATARIVRAVQYLAACTEAQGVWAEADALMKEWDEAINPPGLVAEAGKEGHRWSEDENDGDYASSDDEMADGDEYQENDAFEAMEEDHGGFEAWQDWQSHGRGFRG